MAVDIFSADCLPRLRKPLPTARVASQRVRRRRCLAGRRSAGSTARDPSVTSSSFSFEDSISSRRDATLSTPFVGEVTQRLRTVTLVLLRLHRFMYGIENWIKIHVSNWGGDVWVGDANFEGVAERSGERDFELASRKECILTGTRSTGASKNLVVRCAVDLK